MQKVVIFGSSACQPGSPEYQVASDLGMKFAASGIGVVTGGYSGTMEAVSFGASQSNAVKIEGVIVPSLFPHRSPTGNPFLNVVTVTSSLNERLSKLVDSSNVYVVLPGSVGTLGELVLVWNHINIDIRVNQTSKKHLICFRSPWYDFVCKTTEVLHLRADDIKNIHFVETVEEAVDLSRRLFDA